NPRRAHPDRQRLGLPQQRGQRRLLPGRNPTLVDSTLHAAHQRKGREARPDASTRVGLSSGVPHLEGKKRCPEALPASLQSPTTPWQPRLQASDRAAPRLAPTGLASTASARRSEIWIRVRRLDGDEESSPPGGPSGRGTCVA